MGDTTGRRSRNAWWFTSRVSHAPQIMFDSSPTRSNTSATGGSGSIGSRPLNASKSVRARPAGSAQTSAPAQPGSSKRTVAVSQSFASAAMPARLYSRSASVKKHCSVISATAPARTSVASGPNADDVSEHISQFLRAEGFFEVPVDVERRGFLAPGRRAVGRDDDAAHAAPPLVPRDLAQQVRSVHHGHVDVGQHEVHVARLENGERLPAVARFEHLFDRHVGEADDPFDQAPHHRRIVHDENPHGSHSSVSSNELKTWTR